MGRQKSPRRALGRAPTNGLPEQALFERPPPPHVSRRGAEEKEHHPERNRSRERQSVSPQPPLKGEVTGAHHERIPPMAPNRKKIPQGGADRSGAVAPSPVAGSARQSEIRGMGEAERQARANRQRSPSHAREFLFAVQSLQTPVLHPCPSLRHAGRRLLRGGAAAVSEICLSEAPPGDGGGAGAASGPWAGQAAGVEIIR